jgi:hypothetical protein
MVAEFYFQGELTTIQTYPKGNHKYQKYFFFSNTRLSECLCILEGAAKRRKNCTNCSSATRERQRNKTKDLKNKDKKKKRRRKLYMG